MSDKATSMTEQTRGLAVAPTANPKVMIVDDEPTNINILVDALAMDYDLIVANSGTRALEILGAGERPHLLLLDIMMPDINGFDLCERIKADSQFAHLPVIFLTSLDDPKSEEQGFDVGAVDYITKPIQLSSVRARVRTHLTTGGMLDHLLNINQEVCEQLRKLEQVGWRLAQKERQLGQIEASRDLFESIFKSTYEGIAVMNADGSIAAVNPSFTRITGQPAEEVIGMPYSVLDGYGQSASFHAEVWNTLQTSGHWTGEIYNRRRDGTVYPELRTIMAVSSDGGKIRHYVTIFTDISNLRETERRLEELTWRDPVTGLPNRSLFLDQLSAVLKYCHSGGVTSAVLVVDINNFRAINESLGHHCGDQAIRAFAAYLERSIGEDDTLARLSGDEFAILMAPRKSTADDAYAQATAMAYRLHDCVKKPVELAGKNRIQLNITVGMVLFPTQLSHSPGTVLQHAETAHHNGKIGGQPTTLFEDEMSDSIAKQVALESEIHFAMERKELVLFAQPQYDQTGEMAGMEFLVRWQHPTRGLLGPGEFIDYAEKSRLIVTLERYIIREALAAIPDIRLKHPGIRCSINISAKHFVEDDFVQSVFDAFEQSSVSPDSVIFELTESVMVENTEAAIAKMNRLKKIGCQFSLDDFGTGYSSLSHLSLLPISEIKIDRSFVLSATKEETVAEIIEMIARLGDTMNVRLVAEGVETEEHRTFFRERYPAVLLQGFYFSRPQPIEHWT